MAGVLPEDLIYTFDNVAFGRANYNYGDPEWFEIQAIVQIDQILDSTQQYRDVGGTAPQDFSFTAAFISPSTRQTLLNKIGKVATLTKTTTGQSATVVLKSAHAQQIAAGVFCAAVTFG